MSRILPRYNQTSQAQEDKRKIDKIIGHTPTPTTNPTATAPGDRRKLRGIPVAGGACGTSPGTDPLTALITKRQ